MMRGASPTTRRTGYRDSFRRVISTVLAGLPNVFAQAMYTSTTRELISRDALAATNSQATGGNGAKPVLKNFWNSKPYSVTCHAASDLRRSAIAFSFKQFNRIQRHPPFI